VSSAPNAVYAVYAVYAGNPSLAQRVLSTPDAGRTTTASTLVPLDVRRRSTACCKGRGAVSILLLRMRCEWNKPWCGDYSAAEVCFSCKYRRGLLQILSDCVLLYGLRSEAVSTMYRKPQEDGCYSRCLHITHRCETKQKAHSDQMIENKVRTIQPPRIKVRIQDDTSLLLGPQSSLCKRCLTPRHNSQHSKTGVWACGKCNQRTRGFRAGKTWPGDHGWGQVRSMLPPCWHAGGVSQDGLLRMLHVGIWVHCQD
jgi:hypothetical protein